MKLRASDGEILKTAEVDKPNVCISWNTVLVNDSHGYYVATRWYGAPGLGFGPAGVRRRLESGLGEDKAAARQRNRLVTYAEGRAGGWQRQRLEVGLLGRRPGSTSRPTPWRTATKHGNATLAKFDYKSVLNTPYHGGHFYAETQDGDEFTSKVFRISAADGKLLGVIDYGRPLTSCATSIIAHGMILRRRPPFQRDRGHANRGELVRRLARAVRRPADAPTSHGRGHG